jgi:hypothetical protein
MSNFRRFRHSKPTVRTITVKYAGKCMCCGGLIEAGRIADYYPVGTIAGVHEAKIAHLKAVDGDSKACYAEGLKQQRDREFVDIDRQWEDDCKDRCGL